MLSQTNQLEPQLRQLMVDLCNLPPDFSGSADFYLDLAVPSVKAMELLMELEDRFGIAVPDEQFVEATSLVRLATMVEGLCRNDGPR
jgi:acyl carrier protein